MHPSDPRSPAKPHGDFVGLVLTLFGLMLWLWVSRHSPYTSLPEKMSASLTDPDAYYIREPQYSLFVLVAAASGLWGLIRIVSGLIGALKR